MPRISERRRAIQEIEQYVTAEMILDVIYSDDGDVLDDSTIGDVTGLGFSDAEIALLLAESQRYWNPRMAVPKVDFFSVLEQYDDDRWHRHTRMSRAAFRRIVLRVQGDSVFQNRSTCPQAPVERQCLVAFRRFCTNGNGAGVRELATKWASGMERWSSIQPGL